MNADLHMGEALKTTGKGNLFVVFDEPDITLLPETDDVGQETGMMRVRINGVDIFKPNTGEICSDNADGIACWFVDTDFITRRASLCVRPICWAQMTRTRL